LPCAQQVTRMKYIKNGLSYMGQFANHRLAAIPSKPLNPFNASCCKLLLFEMFSAVVV